MICYFYIQIFISITLMTQNRFNKSNWLFTSSKCHMGGGRNIRRGKTPDGCIFIAYLCIHVNKVIQCVVVVHDLTEMAL
jgi:hypothetical protein